MITKIEWSRGLWIAHLLINGEREEAASRRSYLHVIEVAEGVIFRASLERAA